MKVKRILLGVLLLTGLSLNVSAAEYLVKYRNQVGLAATGRYNLKIKDVHAEGHLIKVDIPNSAQIQTLLNLSSDPNIEYVVPNAKVYAFNAPVDIKALQTQWAIAKVQAEKAWQRAGNKGSKKVLLAVIDTGVDYNHPNLAPNMVTGYDFINNNNSPMDVVGQNPGHGTHCAGIVGASGLIEGGTIGLSPEVSIMPIRFLDENGSGDFNNAVKAIDYAIAQNVQVISASWGATIEKSQVMPLIEAIQRAEAKGIVFVVAAANDGANNDTTEVYPANANLTNTIAVAASSQDDSKPSWSNYGKAKVNLAAPGDGILSTLPGNKYGNLSGTSMATPLVAGLVALVKAQDPSLTPLQIKSLLQATGESVGIQTACDCRINAFNAVDAALSKKMIVSPFATTLAKGDKVSFSALYASAPLTYTSSNTAVATIDAQGALTGVSEGETSVTVKDSKGQTATSYKIYVGTPASTPQPPDNGGGGGGGTPTPPGDGKCPLGDASMCQIICQIQPDLPFCKGR